ncbi:SagB family peptide dehydrogenase [Streptomyces sp. NPDC001922]|uniref:SagB family peptide dehydrogenase n=1 Tax=Streptomyces sp. NPDC001922 TaxID=3364624 RepID=UPI0036AF75D4
MTDLRTGLRSGLHLRSDLLTDPRTGRSTGVRAAHAEAAVTAQGYAVRPLPLPLYVRAHAAALVPAAHRREDLDLGAADIPVLDVAVAGDRAGAVLQLAAAAAALKLDRAGVDATTGAGATQDEAVADAVYAALAHRHLDDATAVRTGSGTGPDGGAEGRAQGVPITGCEAADSALRGTGARIECRLLGESASVPVIGARLHLDRLDRPLEATVCDLDLGRGARRAVHAVLRAFVLAGLEQGASGEHSAAQEPVPETSTAHRGTAPVDRDLTGNTVRADAPGLAPGAEPDLLRAALEKNGLRVRVRTLSPPDAGTVVVACRITPMAAETAEGTPAASGQTAGGTAAPSERTTDATAAPSERTTDGTAAPSECTTDATAAPSEQAAPGTVSGPRRPPVPRGLRAPRQLSLTYEPDEVRLSRIFHENSKMRTAFGTLPAVDVNDMAPAARRLIGRAYRDFRDSARVHGLGTDGPPALAPLEDCVRRRRSWAPMGGGSLTRDQLAHLLNLSYGTTGSGLAGGDVRLPLRATPSAGGLYSCDLFLLVNRVTGIEPGLYYLHPGRRELQLVRADRGWADVTAQTGYQDRADEAAAMVIYTGAFRRNQWKYRERGYRTVLLDCGHLAQSVVLTATALGLVAHPMIAFVDDYFNDLVGVDGVDDAVLYLTLLGPRAAAPPKGTAGTGTSAVAPAGTTTEPSAGPPGRTATGTSADSPDGTATEPSAAVRTRTATDAPQRTATAPDALPRTDTPAGTAPAAPRPPLPPEGPGRGPEEAR